MTPLTDAELEGCARNLVQHFTRPRHNLIQTTAVLELKRLRRADHGGYIEFLDRYIRLVLKTAGVVTTPKIDALMRGDPVKFLDVEIPFVNLPANLTMRFDISEPITSPLAEADVDDLEHEEPFARFIWKVVAPLLGRYVPEPRGQHGDPPPPTPCEIGAFVRREAFMVMAHTWARELVPSPPTTQPVFSA